mmetsp:Transcript_20300/g.49063  ORF Transcript_20300/g.49063 Transcript_20300/m.49063 type:complete len:398 (-) Transcript_20300:1868-3061(-)
MLGQVLEQAHSLLVRLCEMRQVRLDFDRCSLASLAEASVAGLVGELRVEMALQHHVAQPVQVSNIADAHASEHGLVIHKQPGNRDPACHRRCARAPAVARQHLLERRCEILQHIGRGREPVQFLVRPPNHPYLFVQSAGLDGSARALEVRNLDPFASVKRIPVLVGEFHQLLSHLARLLLTVIREHDDHIRRLCDHVAQLPDAFQQRCTDIHPHQRIPANAPILGKVLPAAQPNDPVKLALVQKIRASLVCNQPSAPRRTSEVDAPAPIDQSTPDVSDEPIEQNNVARVDVELFRSLGRKVLGLRLYLPSLHRFGTPLLVPHGGIAKAWKNSEILPFEPFASKKVLHLLKSTQLAHHILGRLVPDVAHLHHLDEDSTEGSCLLHALLEPHHRRDVLP